MQAITFFGNQPSFTKSMALWNFNMGVNGEILRCGISWKRLIVERRGWKFGTRRPRNIMCSVFSGQFCTVSFAKFLMLRFSQGCCSHSFHPISTKLHGKHGIQGAIQAVTFFFFLGGGGDIPKLKIWWHFEIFENSHMGLEISKCYFPYSFHLISAKLHEDIGYHRESTAYYLPW